MSPIAVCVKLADGAAKVTVPFIVADGTGGGVVKLAGLFAREVVSSAVNSDRRAASVAPLPLIAAPLGKVRPPPPPPQAVSAKTAQMGASILMFSVHCRVFVEGRQRFQNSFVFVGDVVNEFV